MSQTLQIEARRPTKRDLRSKYINPTDSVVALVTTKAFPKKKKKEFYEANADLYESNKKAYTKKLKEAKTTAGVLSDARAVAQEFGTANMKGHKPFLRPAMESQAPNTAKKLGEIIARRLTQYKAKQK